MARNWRKGNISNDVTLPLAVPTGTLAGDVVPIGGSGLLGYALTPRATADSIKAGTSNPGLVEGQASVKLLPAQGVVELPVTASSGFAVGDIVHGTQAGSGVVTYAASGAYPVGFVVGKPSATSLDVFLGSHLDVTITTT